MKEASNLILQDYYQFTTKSIHGLLGQQEIFFNSTNHLRTRC